MNYKQRAAVVQTLKFLHLLQLNADLNMDEQQECFNIMRELTDQFQVGFEEYDIFGLSKVGERTYGKENLLKLFE